MQWIDIGVNLTHDSFAPDRAEVINACARAGVVQMIVTGADVAGSAAAVQLGARMPGCCSRPPGCIRTTPPDSAADDLPRLRELLTRPEVVAVGECGLDYYRNLSPRDAQRRAFEWQLGLALESGKPLFLHQRDAHADFLAILRAHARRCAVSRTASRAMATSSRLIWRSASRSASPAGSATSGAAGISRAGAPHPGGAADARDRRALSAATRPETAAVRAPQRADVPAAHRRGGCGGTRRERRGLRRAYQRACARAVRLCRRWRPSRGRNDAAIELRAPCAVPRPNSAAVLPPSSRLRAPPRCPRAPRL